MKFYKIVFISLVILFTNYAFSQISVSNPVVVDAIQSHVFFDGSKNYSLEAGIPNSVGKGMVVPSCNLVSFEFNADFVTSTDSPSYYDGMIIYNSTSGTTLTSGNRSSTATVVSPGFYYFSNPNGATNENITGGKWIPMGSAANNVVKSKTVTVTVPANATEAKLALGTGTILGGEVVTFLGAKIYDSTGENLIMTADSAYNKANNDLTTGNGLMFQVLGEGTYQVVVEYK